MQSIKFQDGKFEVSLQGKGLLHIESPDASAAELMEFKRSITEHLFIRDYLDVSSQLVVIEIVSETIWRLSVIASDAEFLDFGSDIA